MSGYCDVVSDLADLIRPLAETVKPVPCHWISTPDGDHGGEWCRGCGYFKVRNLRRRDRKRRDEYILDGGWRTEHDGFRHCECCGKRLDISLTDWGCSDGILTFQECGFSLGPAEDAYELSEILDHLEYICDDESADRIEDRAAAMALATAFIAANGLSIPPSALSQEGRGHDGS